MGRFVKLRSPDVGEGERRALLSQAEGERATYSRSRASHDCNCGMINPHKFEPYSKWGVGNGEWEWGQGDKGSGRQRDEYFKTPCLYISPSPLLLVPLSPCPLVSQSLSPFLITGYIWSYQNSRSFFRAIKSQTELRGWIMNNRRLTLAIVIVFAALMIVAQRWSPSSFAAVDCG